MLSSRVFIHFAFLCIVSQNHGFEQLSVEIAPIDILNDVVNQIFTSLKFKTNSKSKIKEYSKMHKYFVSLARLEKNNWTELLKVTSLDININNGTADYTTAINEILNEENKTDAVYDTINEENVNKHIEDFLGTLAKIKELYLRNNSYITVNYETLHRFHRNRHSLRNKSVDRLHLLENDSDYWVPDGRRIYQGKRTKIKHFPFLASIHMFNQFSCAGSIIDADLIITAASCLQLVHNNRFYRENPSFLSVRIGSSSYVGGDSIPVLEVYFYPSYEPKSLRNNLAILRLQRIIKFHKKNKNVKKIKVDTNAWALPSNTDGITIIGWGARTASNKIYNPWKNKIAMDVLHFYGLADCRDVYSKVFVTKKNFCAGFISHGGGACNRDVGAPGVVNGVLVGVVSFGSVNCGAHDSPTVFTKLGYYIDWIEDIMEQDHPRQSVRITTRRPILFHTIMSTPPLNDMNFLIEPIDPSKIPDIRDLDVRMAQEDKNQFLNNEFNYKKPEGSRQTFATSMQIMKKKPKEPKDFVDITRLRDETKDSTEITHEPTQLEPIHTIMDNFEVDEILGKTNDVVVKKSTVVELLARTRAQNKELNAKPQWQIDLEHVQNSGSVEDITETPIYTKEFDTYTHNFETNKTPLSGIDKGFEANHTDTEKILSSDDYDDDNETVAVQQSLPVQPISNESGLSIETSEKAFVNKKKDGDSYLVKQPIRNPKEQELDKEIDKFIENLNFEEIVSSDEELKRKVLVDRKLPKLQNNQNGKIAPVSLKRFSLQHQVTKPTNNNVSPQQDQKTKLALKNDDMFPLRDPAPRNDDVFPQQDQETEQAPTNDDTFPLQDQKIKPAPTNYYTFPQQDKKRKPASTNDYMYPHQDQETEPPPTNDDTFPLQDQKTKPAPNNYYTVPLQDERRKPAPTNNDMYPHQDQETELAPTNDDMFPLQDQKTKPAPTNYYTVPLQDERRKPAPTNNYMYPHQDQETELAPTNDDTFPLQDQKIKPAPNNYYTVPPQDERRKPAPTNNDMYPHQDKETELAPTNDDTFPEQDKRRKPASKNDYMYPHQDQETELAPMNDDMFPLQDKKKKLAPNNYYTVPLQDERRKPAPTNYHMYPHQDQETELAPTNDDTFPQQDKRRKPASKNDYMYPHQDQETEPARTNDDILPLQDQKTKLAPKKIYTVPLQDERRKPIPTNDYMYLHQDQETELAPTNDDTFPQQDKRRKPASKNDYMYPHQDQETELAPMNDMFPLQDKKEKLAPKKYYTFPLQDEEIKPAPTKYYTFPLQNREKKPGPTNDDVFLLSKQKAKAAPAHNVVPLLQEQKAKPARMDTDAPTLQKLGQIPQPKGVDIITLLYLSDGERKPDDSPREGLSIETRNFKDLTYRNLQKEASEILPMSLIFDVIAEELRKKGDRSTFI